MDPRRSLIVIIALLIALGSALSFLVYNQSTEIEALNRRQSKLEVEKASLVGEKIDLIKERTVLIEKISELERELMDAKSDNLQLKADLERGNKTIATLLKELEETNAKISELNNQIEEYRMQIAALSLPIAQRHLNASLLAQQDCSQCHGAVAAQALKNEANKYHNIHLNNRLLNFKCTDCHQSVDVSSTSENLTRVVDIETCKKCHTTFPTKSYMNREASPEEFAKFFPFCTKCHDDWRKDMADASYVNLDSITEEDCATCHLKNKLFETEERTVTIPCKYCH